MTSRVAENNVRVGTPQGNISAGKKQVKSAAGKACSNCKEWKDRSEYYQDNNNSDGLTSECKKCRIERSCQWHRDNRDRKRELQRKRYNKEDASQLKTRHRKRHPDRTHARYCLGRARLKGLTLERCSWPGCTETTQIEGHHPSYKKPHEIVSLCFLHHRAVDLLGDKLGFTLPTIDISPYLKTLKRKEPKAERRLEAGVAQ